MGDEHVHDDYSRKTPQCRGIGENRMGKRWVAFGERFALFRFRCSSMREAGPQRTWSARNESLCSLREVARRSKPLIHDSPESCDRLRLLLEEIFEKPWLLQRSRI
jgi:hypothetical protein